MCLEFMYEKLSLADLLARMSIMCIDGNQRREEDLLWENDEKLWVYCTEQVRNPGKSSSFRKSVITIFRGQVLISPFSISKLKYRHYLEKSAPLTKQLERERKKVVNKK